MIFIHSYAIQGLEKKLTTLIGFRLLMPVRCILLWGACVPCVGGIGIADHHTRRSKVTNRHSRSGDD